MFSTLLHYPQRLFSWSDLSRKATKTTAPDTQLQNELDRAAEEGMVATRSRDHTLDDVEVQDIVENGPPSDSKSKKRKAVNEQGTTPEPVGSPKRPRTSARIQNGISTPFSTTVNLTAGANGSSKRKRRQAISEEAMTKQDAVAAPHTPVTVSRPPKARKPKAHPGQEVMMSVVINPEEWRSSEKAAHRDTVELPQDSVSPRATKRQKKPQKEAGCLPANGKESTNVSLEGVSGSVKTEFQHAKSAKASHKRLGSDEVDVPGTQPQLEEQIGVDSNESSEESEDEAPEAVSAAAEKDKARVAVMEADKAAAQQFANEKFKRRERDLRLKLQAKSSKKHSWLDEQLSAKIPALKPTRTNLQKTDPLAEPKSPNGVLMIEAITTSPPQVTAVDEAENAELEEIIPEAATIIEGEQLFPRRPKIQHKAPLPAFLPDEILAAEPVTRLPTPPLSAKKVPMNKRTKFPDVDSKPPKDLTVGKTKVRVLQDISTALPPKASVTGKALRESWLMGRRGLKGNLMVPRRKPSGDFVRK